MAIEINKFISDLENAGILLGVEGDALRYKSPKGAVTGEILQTLKERKHEVVKFLKIKDGNALYFEPIEKVDKAAFYPVSVAQRRMFLLSQIDKESTAYNIINVFKFEGEVDKTKFFNIMNILAKRHDSLRTYFEMVEGRPVQKILEDIVIIPEFEEIAGGDKELDSQIDKFIQPYDMSKAPLFRVKLLRQKNNGGSCDYLLLDMHHIISDGMSGAVLVKDFNELYSGRDIADLNIQYKEFVAWHDRLLCSDVMKKQKKFWLEQLQGGIPVLSMPTDFRRPAAFSFKGDSILFSINKELMDKLYSLARNFRVTLFSVLLAAYTILLSKYSGQTDIVVGTPTAGRRNSDLFNMIGMLVNTLALRNYPEGNKRFADFLKEVATRMLEAFDNQDYPFEQLVDDLDLQRDLSRNPVFDVMFVLQNINVDSIKICEIPVTQYAYKRKSAYFDLTLFANERPEGIDFELNYCSSLYNDKTAQSICTHLINILNFIADNPQCNINEIKISSDEEMRKILNEFNHTYAEYPEKETVNSLFESEVRKTPDSIAVVDAAGSVTYTELNSRANAIAAILRDKGIGREDIVGIMAERSAQMIAGVIGALKAGAAFLPIDPGYPKERIEYMFEDSKLSALLTQEKYLYNIDFHGDTINLDDEFICTHYSENIQRINSSEDVLYAIYTSGTTGNPKGVLLKHKNMVNLCFYQYKKTQIDFAQRVLQFTTLCFDVCYQELFSTLLAGGQLYIIDEQSKKDVRKLFNFIESNKLDIVFLPTAYFKYIINEQEYIDMFPSSIKHIITAGEQLIVTDYFKKYLKNSNLILHNHYGPSETHVVTTYSMNGVQEIPDIPPIGKPVSNNKVYIFDKEMNMQPIGIPGELYISGDNVGAGYLNKEQLSAERFIKDPFNPEVRMYRTGDLARWMQNGDIEFLGRADHQLKIRGFRIEPGEIEAALQKHKDINGAIVIAKDDKLGGKYLCAYIASEKDMKAAEIKEFLSRNLPDYMIPSYFTVLKKMPLTSNGKIDRKALPEPDINLNNEDTFKAPAGETEIGLASIWAEVLGAIRIGSNDNFFELGGHSLKATVLVAKIHKQFGVEFPLSEVFSAKTLKEMAKRIEIAKKTTYSSIIPVEKRSYYLQSPTQRRLFVLKQLDIDSTTYNMPLVLEAEGNLDRNRFETAFKVLVKRHEALRTSFHLIDGEAVQKVHEEVEPDFLYKEARETEVNSIINEIVRPFDLERAPLMRVGLIEVTADKFIIACDMHHIASDGVSVGIIAKEFIQIYNGDDLPEIKIQYRDYAHWQNNLIESGALKDQEDYWLEVFREEVPVLNLVTDYPRPAMQSFEGTAINFEADEELSKSLKQLSAETGTTLYMVLLAAYSILLHKYSGQEDIIIGSPVAGRNHAELENIVGVFLNTLAMRTYPNQEKTFTEFIGQVKGNCLKALENQEYPFEELIEKLGVKRDTSRNPLFSVMFILQNTERHKLNFEGLTFKSYDYNNGISKFDMTLQAMEEDGKIKFYMEYCTRLFNSSTISRMSEHFLTILMEITKEPWKKIRDIDVMSKEEEKKLLIDYNNTYTEYPQTKLVNELFEEQVLRTPDKVALMFKDKVMTYAELNSRSNQLAWSLRSRGVKPDSIIGIMVDRSFDMIVGIMAVLKSGAAYLPIDPEYPPDRVKYMLEDSKTKIILTHKRMIQKFGGKGIPGVEILDMEDSGSFFENTDNLDKLITSTNLAYVIYTSGSTGKPKGVMLEHRSVVNFIKGITDIIDFAEDKSILALTTMSFDIFVLETLLPLSKGVKIVIADEMEQRDSKLLNDIIDKNHVDMLQITPSRLQLLLRGTEDVSCMKRLKTIMVGGEALPQQLLSEVRNLTGARIFNMYGPTETTVWSTVGELTKSDLVDIGTPIANTRVYILDSNHKMRPFGVPGELCIAGDGLARGYFGRKELTDEKFVSDPFYDGEKMYKTGDVARYLPDGRLQCLGRIDQQVKIRGYRIELGEIEKYLGDIEEVKECAVVAKSDESQNNYLVAYYVSPLEITTQELRDHLLKNLPDYMVPMAFMHMERLPQTPNGKIDKKALPDPDFNSMKLSTSFKDAETNTEKTLTGIWKSILRRELVGTEDNFFELGGNSLLLVKMHAELEKIYPGKVSVADIFAYPTISKLSVIIDAIAEDKLSGMKLKTLKLPPEYFGGGDQQDKGTVIKFILDDNLCQRIKKVSNKLECEIEHVLLAAYTYLFYEISQNTSIPVNIVLDGNERALNADFEIEAVKDIEELITLASKVWHEGLRSSTFLLEGLNNGMDHKDEESVRLLFFYSRNSYSIPDTRFFDIVLKCDEIDDSLHFILEYDVKTIRKEKMEEAIYYFINIIETIIERMI